MWNDSLSFLIRTSPNTSSTRLMITIAGFGACGGCKRKWERPDERYNCASSCRGKSCRSSGCRSTYSSTFWISRGRSSLSSFRTATPISPIFCASERMTLCFGERPIGNQVKGAHDMAREYRVLSKLCEIYSSAPRPFLYCEDPAVLNTPFYLMERRRGIVLRKKLPLGMTIDPQTVKNLCTALVDNLATLHSIDYTAAGLGDLGKPEGYVARQVTGWIDRYAKAQTEVMPVMDRLSIWLKEQMPKESGAALIHNDYKYDNILLDSSDLTRIVAVLDWEMATVGDPLMDLGTTLGYWVEASDPEPMLKTATGPTSCPAACLEGKCWTTMRVRAGEACPMRFSIIASGCSKSL